MGSSSFDLGNAYHIQRFANEDPNLNYGLSELVYT